MSSTLAMPERPSMGRIETAYAQSKQAAQRIDHENQTPLRGWTATAKLHRAVQDARHSLQRTVEVPGSDHGASAVVSHLKLTVDMSDSNLEELSEDGVESLVHDVERLVLAKNHLKTLPENFGRCISLAYLNLRSNQFTRLPEQLLELPALQILDLSSNLIVELPDEIEKMKSLRVLTITNNKLQDLPTSIARMDKLAALKLARNPLNPSLRALSSNKTSRSGFETPSETSPSQTWSTANESQDDKLFTVRVKEYLRNLITPNGSTKVNGDMKIAKRSRERRFPITPVDDLVDVLGDGKSPDSPGIPNKARAHLREGSGPSISQRRPSKSPLFYFSERRRSNSESGAQTRRIPPAALRNMEGQMPQSSNLRRVDTIEFTDDDDRMAPDSALLTSSMSAVSMDRSFSADAFPELSPETWQSLQALNDGARGILYSYQSLEPWLRMALESALHLKRGVRHQLEQQLHSVAIEFKYLSRALQASNVLGSRVSKTAEFVERIKKVCKTCSTSLQSLERFSDHLLDGASEFALQLDQQALGKLVLLLYDGSIQAINTANLGRSFESPHHVFAPRPSMPDPDQTVTEIRYQPPAPVPEAISFGSSDRAVREDGGAVKENGVSDQKRLHVDTHLDSSLMNGHMRPAARLDIQTQGLENVPEPSRTGQSFLIPGTPASPIAQPGPLSLPISKLSPEKEDQFMFSRITTQLSVAANTGTTALPQTIEQMEQAILSDSPTNFDQNQQARTVADRCRRCLQTCAGMKQRLQFATKGDFVPDHAPEFWAQYHSLAGSFNSLIQGIKECQVLKPALRDASKTLRPVHLALKEAAALVNDSKWSRFGQATIAIPSDRRSNSSLSRAASVRSTVTLKRYGTNHHAHNSNGSNPPPASASQIPDTPLSAALGPAAQAIMPIATNMSNLDKSFQGTFWNRLDSYISQHGNQNQSQRR